MATPITKPCPRCGHEFTCNSKQLDNKYCSRGCAKTGSARRFVVTLEMFEEAKRLHPGRANSYLAEKLGCCKLTITNNLRRLGLEKQIGWNRLVRTEKTRHLTLTSDRKRLRGIGCLICGEKRKQETAHIVPRRDLGSALEENTMPLCPSHHKFYDHGLLNESEIIALKEKAQQWRGKEFSEKAATFHGAALVEHRRFLLMKQQELKMPQPSGASALNASCVCVRLEQPSHQTLQAMPGSRSCAESSHAVAQDSPEILRVFS